jgi:hypothetical protein
MRGGRLQKMRDLVSNQIKLLFGSRESVSIDPTRMLHPKIVPQLLKGILPYSFSLVVTHQREENRQLTLRVPDTSKKVHVFETVSSLIQKKNRLSLCFVGASLFL